MRTSILITILSVISSIRAHSGELKTHETNLKDNVPEGLTWQQWHMKEEHNLDLADSETFFNLHDFRNSGSLNKDDILKLYGLARDEVVGDGDGMGSHDDSEGISQALKDEVVAKILYLMDSNNDGEVSKEEFLKYANNGANEFPDVGVGIGHHLDFEEEYERHHWDKYHAKDDPDVKIVHLEDIEHELLHHEHEIEHGNDEVDQTVVVTNEKDGMNQIFFENIPYKYKRA